MYAIIRTGGKQYWVTEGQTLKIEKLAQDIGASVKFDDILLIGEGDELHIGSPQVKGAQVTAEIVDQGRVSKINIIKFKRRKHHMKRMGHRQDFTTVKVTGIRYRSRRKEKRGIDNGS
ncbi:50S ribosomal protein L21 [Candidatus Coxiella mudrowiae]|uniref:Large ribosomal subunit protein bL21 n=1 Tax=Candidatus Coxiella mudrowiae TaxID=2054173 RepID=A0ABN4HQ56_9COXI|nr:50S ribosomal protein L21 [Candidatus Coxiella mudrowiae]AKQ33847.1 50S ribosomal protein L21 [Candidatus Coxiella mudrowiae]